MFNNRFNSSKNDPLVEAVKQAQADGDMRRQAIAAVNEQFGVFSRNAVVREDLAAYDAAIEEAYKSMKEGITVVPSEINPVPRKPEVGGGDVPHQTGSGKTINPKDNKEIAVESKKLAKKDYDKDGKIESPKDEVWGSRFRAAKMAGKMEEGSAVSGEDPGMEVAKKAGAAQQSQTPSSTPARTGNAAGSTISNARSAAGMNEAQLDELKKPTPKTAMKAYYRAYDSDVRSGEGERSNRLYNWKQKHLPGKSARNQKDTGKAELDDYDRKTVKKSGTLTRASQKDTKAEIKSRLGKHTKPKHLPEETIEEATRKHFRQHAADIAKISDQDERNKAASSAASTYARLNPRFDHAKFHAAAGSTAHQEPKKMEEAAYSAKAAREGKDIGKPGKMFSKIAKKAGEKYGSEERGKKVAGAILKKIRAKHMKEDQSFKSAQVIEANAFDLGKTVPDTSMKIRGGAYPSVAARVKDMAGSFGRGLVRGFGNPVSAGVMGAMDPTPANYGENEFARQAKFAPKPSAGRTGSGINRIMNRSEMGGMGVRAKQDARPSTTSTPKPAPAPVPQTATTNKAGFYKGGSMGDVTVKSGQTLSSIAKSTGQSVADLAKMNNISDVNKISAGAKLMTKVPTPPSRPADISTPAPAAKPAEPEFKGRMIPPNETGVGATPPKPSFIGSKRDMRQGGPMTEPLSSKDFANQPPSSLSTPAPKAPAPEQKKKEAGAVPAPAPMAECVQVGVNKYRIV